MASLSAATTVGRRRVRQRNRAGWRSSPSLQSALRGPLDASNLYVNRTELHELLAQAWDAMGVRDSAAAHYRIVMAAWGSADPPLAARVQAAKARVAALAR